MALFNLSKLWVHNDIVAYKSSKSSQFTSLLGVSFVFDIIWMIKNDQHGFFKFLSIFLLLLKIPTFFAFLMSLRQRGHLGLSFTDSTGPPGTWNLTMSCISA